MTNSELFQDAIGLIDESYITELMAHRPARSLRRRVIHYASLAACLCLLIGTATGIGLGRIHSRNGVLSSTEILPPVALDEIIWGAEDELQQQETSSILSESEDSVTLYLADSLAILMQNGWEMSGELHRALKAADPNTYLAISVSRSYDYNAMMSFTHQGKSYGEWLVERDIWKTRKRKLSELIKEGEWLKYGAALYTQGTPDGEKWTRELYEERVDFYGAYFLSEYICNGTLLSDKIEQDLSDADACLQKMERILSETMNAYETQNAHEDFLKFAKKGVCCAIRNGRLYIFITPKKLSRLHLRGKSDFVLSLADRSGFVMEEADGTSPD